MAFQEFLDTPINREQPRGDVASENQINTLIDSSTKLLSKGFELFQDANKDKNKTDAISSYNNEMNRLYQAKQQGSLSERSFRAAVSQKHIEMSNTYQGQYTQDFLQQQQNLFGYNVVGGYMQGDKTPEQMANEVASKLKVASLEQYQKENPGVNIASNPDFYDDGVFNMDKAYNFVSAQSAFDQQIAEGNPNSAIQKFTAEAAPFMAQLRSNTSLFGQLQGQQGSSSDNIRAQQQLQLAQQDLTNALEQRRINILAQLPVTTSAEVRKNVDDSLKNVIESAKAIVPYMNENFTQTQKAIETNLGIDGLQAGHMLVTLKEAGISDDVISNIVQLKLTQNPQLQETVFKSLDDAVQSVTKRNDVVTTQTLTALRDWTKDPQKSIMDYDTSTRQNMINAGVQNIKSLSSKSVLNPNEQQGWFNSSMKVSGLAPLANDPNQLINLSNWFATPAWRDQFKKQANVMGKDKANVLADNVRALQIDAFQEYSIKLNNTRFFYTERVENAPMVGRPSGIQMDPGVTTLPGSVNAANVSVRNIDVQPVFNTQTGLIEVDPRVSLSKEQQQMVNFLNQNLTTFADLNQYDEASMENRITGIAARELVARGLLNVEVKGESSLPKGEQSVTPDAINTYFESLKGRAASDNFLQGVNQYRERVNAFARNINANSFGLSDGTPTGGADETGDSFNVSLIDINGDLNMENIKGTIAEEGLRNKVYVDTTGNRTVGIGFNMDSAGAKSFWKEAGINNPFDSVYRGQSQLTEEEAIQLFNVTKRHAYDNASKLVKNWDSLGANRQAALADMVFQMGVAGVKGFKNSLKLIEDGDFQGAAANLMRSRWARQTPARAARVAEMIASDQDRFTVNDRLVSQGKVSRRSSIT